MDDAKLHERGWLAARLLGWGLIVLALSWEAMDKARGAARNVEVLMRVVQVVGVVIVAVGFERHARWAQVRAREEASRTRARG